jgi:hypothetical protein
VAKPTVNDTDTLRPGITVSRSPGAGSAEVDFAVPPFGTWAQRALAVQANLLDVADGVEDATAAALGNSGGRVN